MSNSFNTVQYQALADKLENGVAKLSQKKAELVPTAQREGDRWFIPKKIAEALMWVAERMEDIAQWVLERIKDALKAVLAPITLFLRSGDWIDGVKVPASTVQGLTDWKALKAPMHWEGDAADTYVKAVRGQSPAAGRIATIAEKVSFSCTACAAAGLVFYAALAVVLAKLITATIAAIGALMTGIGAPLAAALFVEEAVFDTAAVIAAISALAAFLGLQVEELNRITSEAQDNADFPGGKWPSGTA